MKADDPVPMNMEHICSFQQGRPDLQFSNHVIIILIDAPISDQLLLQDRNFQCRKNFFFFIWGHTIFLKLWMRSFFFYVFKYFLLF